MRYIRDVIIIFILIKLYVYIFGNVGIYNIFIHFGMAGFMEEAIKLAPYIIFNQINIYAGLIFGIIEVLITKANIGPGIVIILVHSIYMFIFIELKDKGNSTVKSYIIVSILHGIYNSLMLLGISIINIPLLIIISFLGIIYNIFLLVEGKEISKSLDNI